MVCVKSEYLSTFEQLVLFFCQCCEMLDYLGVPYVQSRGEAEAMCAVLNSEGVSNEGEDISQAVVEDET